jgi:hypothetical protein
MGRYSGHQKPKTPWFPARQILMVDDHEDIPLILSER